LGLPSRLVETCDGGLLLVLKHDPRFIPVFPAKFYGKTGSGADDFYLTLEPEPGVYYYCRFIYAAYAAKRKEYLFDAETCDRYEGEEPFYRSHSNAYYIYTPRGAYVIFTGSTEVDKAVRSRSVPVLTSEAAYALLVVAARRNSVVATPETPRSHVCTRIPLLEYLAGKVSDQRLASKAVAKLDRVRGRCAFDTL